MEKIAKIVRYATVAPAMALMALVVMLCFKPVIFGGFAEFILAVFFLVILPLLAYPLQKFLPHFKDLGRDGQRSLAMIFAVAGYCFGCIANFFMASSKAMWIIYLEYLLSGLCIFIFNKCFGLKASGHACGAAGPAALLCCFGIYFFAAVGVLLTALVWWASIKTERHTLKQLIGGTAIPTAVIIFLGFIMSFLH